MYSKISVDNRDIPFRRILWRQSPEEPIKSYELTTFTFGLASSSYLAFRCLKKLAEDGDNFPVLLRTSYYEIFMSMTYLLDRAGLMLLSPPC